MIYQELLRSAVGGHHSVLQDFVETLAPTLLIEFSSKSALGGSADAPADESDNELPPEAIPLTQRDREAFSRGYDQSLAAHLFNGIFAGVRVAALLPEEIALRDEEWRVWILGFVVHDYTKDHQIQMRAEHIAAIRSLIAQDGDRLQFSEFFPQWRDYLDDIVFIAQNTQTVKGANLDTHLYPNLLLRPIRRERLRMLASFVDVLVHIRRPSDVAERDRNGRDRAGNLRKKLSWLFDSGAPPRLAYHQLTEVRGLISNLINNALMRALEEQGYQPYLFFPDGVVYLVTNEPPANINSNALINAMWSEVGTTLSGINGADASNNSDVDDQEDVEGSEELDDTDEIRSGGMRITRAKDYLKVPPVLYELLSFEQVLTAARSAALNITAAKTAARLGAEVAEDQGLRISGTTPEKQKRYTEIGQQFAANVHLPVDVRVDCLAEYCAFLHRRLKAIFPNAEWLPELLLEIVDIRNTIPVERVYRNNGGTPTGWFYAASHYIKQNPEISKYDLDELLLRVQKHALNFLQQYSPQAKTSTKEAAWYASYQRFIGSTTVNTSQGGRFESAFRDYLSRTISIDGKFIGNTADMLEQFAKELQQYSERKAANKVQCSLCSSPYEARQQDKSEVLFKPQQYSNKNKLDSSTVVRGICPICALEMMLRQVQQGMRSGSAQDEKPIVVYLYPTYFFTSEAAHVIHGFINQLRDLSLPALLWHLGSRGFNLTTLANYEAFITGNGSNEERSNYSLNKPHYSDRDPASLFFFALRAPMQKKKLTDTDAWIDPAFYALALPLLLDIKVVVSSSFTPLYSSGADFRETTILDAPHSFINYILGNDRLRVNEIEQMLWRLLHLYELHLDVFKDPISGKREDMHFSLLNAVAKDIVTDPLYIFSYYDRKQRKPKDDATKAKKGKAKAKKSPTSTKASEGISLFVVERYMAIYKALKTERNDPMSFISKLVDSYAVFYRADYAHLDSAYTVLRPLGTAIDITKNSSPDTYEEDLILFIAGAIEDEMDRVKHDAATSGGYDPLGRKSATGLERSRQAIKQFAEQFIELCFKQYCGGDRGILRERANRIRSAANFYYLSQPYARRNRA